MSENKVKPRFNVVDAIVLIAVIAIVAGIGYRALYKPIVDATTEKVDVTLTVRIRGVSVEVAESFITELPAPCVSFENVVPGSSVKSAYIEPNYWVGQDTNGVPVESAHPFLVDLVATVEGTCPNDGAIYLIGNQEARIGRTFVVKTRNVELPGTVTDMTVTSAK